jgi:hypothetical protein
MSVIARMSVALVAAVALTGCISDDTTDDADGSAAAGDDAPTFEVTVPATRLTPFCQAMNELADELLSDETVDGAALIVETYRSIIDDVPDVIASDFAAVLAALEDGAPPPTDPTIVTTTSLPPAPGGSAPPTAVPVTDASGSTIPSEGDAFFDEGYGPGTSPAERVNEYVGFACRGTENNPGPPATQPLTEPDTAGAGDG